MRSKFSGTVLALGALALALPAPALAAKPKRVKAVTRTLTGQVVGSSFPSGSRVGVPVLLHAASVRRAKLRGPLALLKLPRSTTVRVPGNRRIALSALRAGDVFRARLPVSAAARRAAYPAVNAPATTFAITRRGTAPSPAELQDQIAALSGYLGALTGYVISQFADLRGQVTSLRSDLGGLSSSLAALQAQVNALPPSMQVQVTELITEVTQLETQLQTLTTQLSTVTSDVATLTTQLQGIGPGDLADALSDIAALQALVGGIDVGTLQTSLSTLGSQVAAGDASLQGQIDAAEAALATAQGQLSFLCSAGLVKGPLLSLSLAGSCPA